MQRIRLSCGIVLVAAVIAACSDRPHVVEPIAGADEARALARCEVEDDAVNRIRTITAGCLNTEVAVPEGWAVRRIEDPPATSGRDTIDVVAANPTFSAIENPDSAYVASTALVDVSDLPPFAQVPSISDGVQTVTFTSEMLKLTVPAQWSSWSCPPFAETCTPHVLFSQGELSVGLTLSEPAAIVGFELSPNLAAPIAFSAHFYSEGRHLGSVTRSIDGAEGARLLAASVEGVQIDQVVVTGTDGFAIARFRYGVAQPPPPVEVTLEAVYSGDPARSPGTISLDDDQVYVEILDVEQFLGRAASASDVRIGNTWEQGVEAEEFRVDDLNRDGRRDVRLRWSLQSLVDAGRLNPATRELLVWGRDSSTAQRFLGRAEVEVATDDVVLFDNGGFVTHPGAGAGGADVHLPATVYFGVGAASWNGGDHFRVADRFRVTDGAWDVSRIVTYASQEFVAQPAWTTFHANVWSGRPGDEGSSIVATTTSASTSWTGAYAVRRGTPLGDSTFRVFEVHWNTPGLSLPEGEYWIDWQVADGNAWVHFVTLPNPASPGDPILVEGVGRQLTASGWQDILESAPVHTPATPFRIVGRPALDHGDRR